MGSLISAAFKVNLAGNQNVVEGKEPVQVKAKVDEIDESGNVMLKFEPGIVIVPNDWEKLWSIEEREKMNYQDRLEFENALLDIMHVKFE